MLVGSITRHATIIMVTLEGATLETASTFQLLGVIYGKIEKIQLFFNHVNCAIKNINCVLTRY